MILATALLLPRPARPARRAAICRSRRFPAAPRPTRSPPPAPPWPTATTRPPPPPSSPPSPPTPPPPTPMPPSSSPRPLSRPRLHRRRRTRGTRRGAHQIPILLRPATCVRGPNQLANTLRRRPLRARAELLGSPRPAPRSPAYLNSPANSASPAPPPAPPKTGPPARFRRAITLFTAARSRPARKRARVTALAYCHLRTSLRRRRGRRPGSRALPNMRRAEALFLLGASVGQQRGSPPPNARP